MLLLCVNFLRAERFSLDVVVVAAENISEIISRNGADCRGHGYSVLSWVFWVCINYIDPIVGKR